MVLRFLLLEANPRDADVIQATLMDGAIDCELLRVETRSGFVTALQTDRFDLILAAYALPDFDSISALDIARNLHPDVPFIFVSASLGEELAIETLKHGATDYVLKQRLGRLVPSVQRALRDAQERHECNQAEQELRQTNQTLSTLIESSPLPIVVIEPDATVQIWNPAATRLFGWSEAEVLGQPIPIVPQNKLEECLRVREAVAKGETFSGIETYRCKSDGSGVSVSISAAPLYDKGGTVKHIMLVFQDITDRQRAEAASRESEERFRNMADNTPVLLWIADTSKFCTYFNKPWLDFTGRTMEQELGNGWVEGVHPDDLQHCLDIYNHSFDARQEFKMEYRLRRFDGEYRWIIDHGIPRFTPNGEFLGYIGSGVDIHDRKQAEEIIAANEARLRGFVDANVVGILYGDIYGGIFEANDELLRIVGYTREDLYAGRLQWIHITPPEHLPLDEQAIAEARANGACTPYEKEYIRKDGSRVPVLIGYSLVGEAREESVAFILDLSERKQAEAALRESENRLRLALESAELGTWDFNPVTGILTWDDQCKAMFGLSPEAEVNYDIFLAGLHPDDRDHTHETVLSSLSPEGEGEYDIEYRTVGIEDGVERWIAARGKAFFNYAGVATRFIGTVLNITEKKRAEAEREQLLQRERAARETAEAANRIKDEFLAVVSHELRSPLNPILGWTSLLRGGKLDAAKTAHALKTIERNTKLQAQLIEDLLDVSRILRGKLSLNMEAINLVSIIEAAMETVRLAAEAKEIQIQTTLNATTAEVLGDAARLQQIVWNLLTNAVKFTPEGGQVEVCLEKIDSSAQIRVRDTGKGISFDFLPHVFDYFRQADTSTTRKFGGLGLGLAIVHHLVELHGGTVHAESSGEGQGATFTVRLPLIKTNKAIENATPVDSSIIPSANSLLMGVKVLIVDDDEDTRDFHQFVLEQYGAIVTTAASANEALQALVLTKPDVLLSDIGMPDMDGYALIRQVRAWETEQGKTEHPIRAIALTAYAGEINQQQALAAGFQQHIPKPVPPEKLLDALLDVLEQ